MILGSIWRGECQTLAIRSVAFSQASATLGIPLVALQTASDRRAVFRAYLASEILLPDVRLCDVLHEEIGLEVPDHAVVFTIPATFNHGSEAAFPLLAEALHLHLKSQVLAGGLELFLWALRSFALSFSLTKEELKRFTSEFLGAPCNCSASDFMAYLLALQPNYIERRPDPALSERLSLARDWGLWWDNFQEAYAHSAQVELNS